MLMPILCLYLVVAIFVVPFIGQHLAFSVFYRSTPDADRDKNLAENSERLLAAERTLLSFKQSLYKTKQLNKHTTHILHPQFCFVIVSVSRPAKVHFLTQVVAALLPQLQESESVFTVYNAEGFSHLEAMELANCTVPVMTKEGSKQFKNLFDREKEDYVYALEWCKKKRARYTVILEDDALPPTDFMSRLRFVLKNRNTLQNRNWAFLKLYYPEKWQGWSNERVLELIMTSIFVGVILTIFAYIVELILLGNSQNVLIRFLLSCILALYMLLTLGRPHWLALRKITPYLSFVVTAPGCCTPAVLYPQDHLTNIIDYLHQTECTPSFPIDLALDKFAGDRELDKYLVVPNLFKHIGFVSTLGKSWKDPLEFRFR